MIVFLGTAANSVAFQAFLLDGVTRWNADRAVGAVQDPDNTLYTFDKFLQHQLNSLTMSIRNEEFSPHFTPPGKYTGELIGVEYLRSQSDSFVDKDLEKEIDDAFEDYQSEADETTEETQEIHDLTLALPFESSDSDSGTEVCATCKILHTITHGERHTGKSEQDEKTGT